MPAIIASIQRFARLAPSGPDPHTARTSEWLGNRFIGPGAAVKSVVPEEMWGEIIEKIEEFEQHQEVLDVGTDSYDDDDDDEPYDPIEFIDEDDDF